MKKIFPAIALIAAFSAPLIAPTVSAQNNDAKKPAAEYKSKAPKLNRAQVDEWLAKPDKVVFVDLRRPDELTSIGGLPVYLSIQSKELEKYISYIPKDRAIITVSNHAGRAGKSADLLIDKGYKVVGIVGVQNYEEEGGTLVKIAPPAPKPEANKTAAAQ
jgi:rhodanese-related sulfurtransferase